MTKPNSFVKNLKNIIKSINSLLERNLNKIKFDNLKIVASNNKIILTFVAVFVFFISYLLLPTFYKYDDISKELKNELLTKYELDFTFTKNLKYNFFPRPHFIIKESSIIQDQKNISEIDTLKIFVSLNNLFSLKNINVNEVILDNANFELEAENSNFFFKLLNNNWCKLFISGSIGEYFFLNFLNIENNNSNNGYHNKTTIK